jgi:5-methylthioadenosine/S-adenosylhomocysteine deaminase
MSTVRNQAVRNKRAVAGRVVTMDADHQVLNHGVVYLDAERIIAVQDAKAKPPAGFEAIARLETQGSIYPGLIELHNHLSYNALPLWDVPKKFSNRDQWAKGDAYRSLISGPMRVIGLQKELTPALTRYVEAKCLLAGVTTSQGVSLMSNAGIERFYAGSVRNVETGNHDDLPAAATKISDVEATQGDAFLKRLDGPGCVFLHLSEGTDDAARQHFLDLKLPNGKWAISKHLCGIHAVALEDADFKVLGEHGAAMVWSPTSNLLLYGQTANVKSAKRHGVRIGLGADWSPSGSKNLLHELKIARIVAKHDDVFSDQELVSMVTRDAAQIVGWDKGIGSLEAGKRGDLMLVDGQGGDPYAHLLEALETDISLVLIDGLPRAWGERFNAALGNGTESCSVGGQPRSLNFPKDEADPVVKPVSLAKATASLGEAFHHLKDLAKALNAKGAGALQKGWFLIDNEEEEVTRTFFHGGIGALKAARADIAVTASKPLSELLKAINLDPLTVPDDQNYMQRMQAQHNLPTFVKEALKATRPNPI